MTQPKRKHGRLKSTITIKQLSQIALMHKTISPTCHFVHWPDVTCVSYPPCRGKVCLSELVNIVNVGCLHLDQKPGEAVSNCIT